jgi:2-amino-4-hydroxy-6-hydroxymethyldihydropteridine diphosphokinase
MHECLIAFGSNEGNRREVYLAVVDKLKQTQGLQITATSKPLVTDAVGGPDKQATYLNGAIRIETSLNPTKLHRRLIEIENELGRLRRERWGSRTIDLDLLLYGQEQIHTADLTVPHPRMSFRRFVLEPACEIAGYMIHPPSAKTLHQLVSRLNEADNLILCIDDPLIEELLPTISAEIRNDSGLHWDLRSVKSQGEFRDLETQAKLVAYFQPPSKDHESDVSLQQLHSAARSFSGPTLELPRDVPQAKLELLAAIEAMNPLR